MESVISELVAGLTSRGVTPLLLKGAGTARWLYDSIPDRAYNDIDLMVAPEDWRSAHGILESLGFVTDVAQVTPYHDVLIRPGSIPVFVELHRTLVMLGAPPRIVWEQLSADAERVMIGGVPVSVPAPAAAALIVVLHAVQHGVAAGRPITDLVRATERVHDEVWRDAAALADTLDAGSTFAFGLRLVPTGRRLATRLELNEAPVTREAYLRGMAAPETALGWDRLVNAHGLRPRLAMLADELVPAPSAMRVWKPIARRRRWGLAVAYAWRPLWLLTKLPRGVVAVRRAETRRRSARC